VTGLEAAQKAVGELVVEAQLPMVGQMRRTGYEGEGWAIVRHADTEVVAKALRTLVTSVRVTAG
jgi:hypothetical protein